MAEFDPDLPHDAAEAAYRDALLGDDAGREPRRARLMAALPRPPAVEAVAVAPAVLAWRWQPYALGLLVTGLLLATLLVVWKGRRVEPKPEADARLAARPAASAATVVAQASPRAEPAPAAARPAKTASPQARAAPPATAVVADAAWPRPFPGREAGASAVTEAARSVPPPPPAATAVAAASVPQPRAMVEAEAAQTSSQAEALARFEQGGAARGRLSSSLVALRASELRAGDGFAALNAVLLAGVGRSDADAVRAALQAGAWAGLRDAQGRTVLMLAARSGAREVVDALLAAGASRTDRDPAGLTAADHAQGHGHAGLAERLR